MSRGSSLCRELEDQFFEEFDNFPTDSEEEVLEDTSIENASIHRGQNRPRLIVTRVSFDPFLVPNENNLGCSQPSLNLSASEAEATLLPNLQRGLNLFVRSIVYSLCLFMMTFFTLGVLKSICRCIVLHSG